MDGQIVSDTEDEDTTSGRLPRSRQETFCMMVLGLQTKRVFYDCSGPVLFKLMTLLLYKTLLFSDMLCAETVPFLAKIFYVFIGHDRPLHHPGK